MKKTIASPKAPKAVGPYSQAVELNGTLFLSGQLPIDPAAGKMPEGIGAQTRQSLTNIGAVSNETESGDGPESLAAAINGMIGN